MAASKSIVADLNQGDKLTENNYDIWYRKLQFLLEEQDMLATVTQQMQEPEPGNTLQHRRDIDAYQSFKNKDRVARILMLSSTRNDLMLRFFKYRTAKEVWDAVKLQFGGTSTTRLRSLNLKFDGYSKRHDHSMRQHLITMSNMIAELSAAGRELTDEEQVQAVIKSLPKKWNDLKLNLTYNDNIKTFDDVSRHLELEEDRLGSEHDVTEAHMAESSGHKRGKNKRNKGKGGGKYGKTGPNKAKFKKRNKGNRTDKKDKSKMECFKCEKLGHFARECTEKKVQPTT